MMDFVIDVVYFELPQQFEKSDNTSSFIQSKKIFRIFLESNFLNLSLSFFLIDSFYSLFITAMAPSAQLSSEEMQTEMRCGGIGPENLKSYIL